jgi:armadillo repeat-containing protein 8
MTRGFDVPASLQVLRSATTPQKQLDALKQLKNDIIGHEKRKQIIISHGVAELLSRCLGVKAHRSHRLRRSQDRASPSGSPISNQDLDLEDQVRLQALFITTSLAHGRFNL